MRTQHLENVLRFLELFTNNCENRTQKYIAQDCIIQVKKSCRICYEAIQCLVNYKNDLTQLYRWNILTYYCLLYYYDFIESAVFLLKYRIKHPLGSCDTDNFNDLKRESRQLSYFKASKDSSVLYYVKALKEETSPLYHAKALKGETSPLYHVKALNGESSSLYHVKALKRSTYIRGERIKPEINSVSDKTVSERPEKRGGGISESRVNLFSDDILKDITYDYIKHLDYNDEKAEAFYHLLTDKSDRKWYYSEEDDSSYFDFRVLNKEGECPIVHRSFIGALRYLLKSYTMEQIFDEYITIECWFTTKTTSGIDFVMDNNEVMLLKYLHSERSEKEVKEGEHNDSY